MTGAWLEWLGNAMPILLLLPLVWLVAGFLLDSLRSGEQTQSETQKTRKNLINGAVWDLFLVCLWGYVLVNEMRDADGSRIFIGVLLAAIILVTYQIIRAFLEAHRLGGAEAAHSEV